MPPRSVRERWNNLEKDVVVVHQMPKGKTCPSPSPFPLKLETFLRIAGVKYENDWKYWRSSKGKTPWITVNKKDIADSQLSMEFVRKNMDKDINSHLTPEEAAIARGFQVTLDERFYWCMALDRFVFNQGKNFPDLVDFGMPMFLFKAFIKYNMIPTVKKQAHGHGIGRHTDEEIKKIARDDLKSFANYLGNKPFLMGDTPTEVDCSLFAMLCMVLFTTPDDDFLKIYLEKEHQNLVDYVTRMKEKYWPDWDDCLAGAKPADADKK